MRIDSFTIRQVHVAKYFGIIIDDKMSRKDHIDYIPLKIKRNIGMMKNLNLFEALYTLQSLGLLHNNLIETINNDRYKLYVYYRLQ